MTIQEAKNVLPPEFSWVDVSDEGFRNALADIVERKSEVLLVLGQGGCGKSVLYEIAYHLNPSKTKPWPAPVEPQRICLHLLA